MTSMILALVLTAQLPPVPDKSPLPGIPGKSTPLASPQAQASPQQSYAPQYDVAPQATVVLRAPTVYAVQRQILVQAAPVSYAAVDDVCAGVQQQVVVQRAVVHHQPIIQRNVIVAHAPRQRGLFRGGRSKTVTKSRTVTKTR